MAKQDEFAKQFMDGEAAGGDKQQGSGSAIVDLEIGTTGDGGAIEEVDGGSETELRAAFGEEPKAKEEQAGEKPGEQPPASEIKAEEPKKPEEKPTEEGANEFDKIEKPTPDDWRKMREAHKAAKREARELREKGGVPPPKTETERKEPEAAAIKPTNIDASEVFKVFAEVVGGENDKISREKVEEFIANNLTPGQVAETIMRAKRNEFGDRSAEILALAQEQLPMVQAMSGVASNKRAEQKALVDERESALTELLTAYPEARDENSQQFKVLAEAARELQTLIHPSVMNLPNAPRLIKRYMDMQKDVAGSKAVADENKRLAAENEALRKQLGRPAAPGGGGGKKVETSDADAWLKKELATE